MHWRSELHEQSGLEGVRRLRALDKNLSNDSDLQQLMGELGSLYERVCSANELRIATIADPDALVSAHK